MQSDVWALGCCVYEMATLKHAFNAKDMNSLVYRIVEGKVTSVTVYNVLGVFAGETCFHGCTVLVLEL